MVAKTWSYEPVKDPAIGDQKFIGSAQLMKASFNLKHEMRT
ncbi:MAG: hypothetical protein PVG74_10960 [Desulfobacterales bacterium]